RDDRAAACFAHAEREVVAGDAWPRIIALEHRDAGRAGRVRVAVAAVRERAPRADGEAMHDVRRALHRDVDVLVLGEADDVAGIGGPSELAHRTRRDGL